MFEYDHAFMSKGIEISPLNMPLGRQSVYALTSLPEETYRRLPPVLNDALPDDFGNALINSYLPDRGIAVESITPLDRLAYMGARAMGALTFKPARRPAAARSTALDMSDLVEEARRALRGDVLSGARSQKSLKHIIDVGTSAGGARAKAVIAMNSSTGEIRAGQFDAPPGFDYWLLKFDGLNVVDQELGQSHNYGRIEYAYYLMARHSGIEMTECRLLEENGRSHFMTRRFDRGDNGVRHHIQSLCALSNVDFRKKATNSYAQLFGAIDSLDLPYEQREEAFRRMVFNVMGMNCDDHSKNFAFLLRRDSPWQLAPAYDITFAYNPRGEWTHQHLMSVNGRFKDISVDDLLAVADRFKVGTARSVIEQVRSAILKWPDFAEQAALPSEQIDEIRGLLRPGIAEISPRNRHRQDRRGDTDLSLGDAD